MLRLMVACVAVMLGAGAALADLEDDCRNMKGEPSIKACTKLINSPNATRNQVGHAYIDRGQHYYEMEQFDKAIEDFNRAIPLKPKWVQLAFGNRGNCYFRKGEDDKAIDSYDQAIAIDPQYASAYTSRGLLYEKAGATERAKSDFQAALRSNPVFADTKWAHETARRHLDAMEGK